MPSCEGSTLTCRERKAPTFVLSELAQVGCAPGSLGGTCWNGGLVRLVNPLEDSDWDGGLRGVPGLSFFYGSAWARVLHDTYGFRPVYVVHRDSERLECLLPLMEVDSWLTGRRGVSLPFTDVCAPFCVDRAAFGQLFEEVTEHAKARGWKYIECRGGKELLEGATASTTFYTHRLPLVNDEELLFANVDGAVRRAIRKSHRSGLTVEMGQDITAIREFYGLQCKTRQRHGLPPQPDPWRPVPPPPHSAARHRRPDR